MKADLFKAMADQIAADTQSFLTDGEDLQPLKITYKSKVFKQVPLNIPETNEAAQRFINEIAEIMEKYGL